MNKFFITKKILFSIIFLLLVTNISHSSENKSKNDKASTNTEKKPVLTVTTQLPKLVSVDKIIEANGNIEAREISIVNSQVSGLRLNKILVDIGDVVKKGQILAEYDSAPVKIDLAQAKANLKKSNIALQQAKSSANRARKLRNSKAISEIEKDNFLFQEKRAQAGVEAAQSILQKNQLHASYAAVRTKVDGLIIIKQATLGSIDNPGSPLFSIITNNELEWRARVPSNVLSIITKNMPVTINIPYGNMGTKIKGRVRSIDPIINSKTFLGTVYVSMEKHPLLRKGLFIKGKFHLGEKKLLSIPSSSIIRKDGYSYVFIADENNHAIKTKVHIERATDNMNFVSISYGLYIDSRVIIDGVGFLKNGDTVNVIN